MSEHKKEIGSRINGKPISFGLDLDRWFIDY